MMFSGTDLGKKTDLYSQRAITTLRIPRIKRIGIILEFVVFLVWALIFGYMFGSIQDGLGGLGGLGGLDIELIPLDGHSAKRQEAFFFFGASSGNIA